MFNVYIQEKLERQNELEKKERSKLLQIEKYQRSKNKFKISL